jgi:hypothetical protein
MDKEKPIYWSAILPKIMHNLNTQKDISKDVSPFDIMCNRKPHLKENSKIINSFEFFLQSLMNLDEEDGEEDLIIEDNIENYIEENSTHNPQFISSEEPSDSSISVNINHINNPAQFNEPMNLLADVASYNNTTEITDIINTKKRTPSIDGNGSKRMKQSAGKISYENSFGHKANFGDKFKPMREILLEESSRYRSITLIENKSKLLISDKERCLLHFSDFDGNILKSFNLNHIIKIIASVCVLESDSNEEKIFVADDREEIFVFDSNFKRIFQFGNPLRFTSYMKIDNEFDRTRLYVSEYITNEITIRSTVDGKFIGQIIGQIIGIKFDRQIEIIFTRNSVFVSGLDVCSDELSSCIFEIDKASLEIKRRIIFDWCSPYLLNIEPNGNLQIAAFTYDRSDTSDHCDTYISEILYFLTVDQNGKIIEKAKLHEYDDEYISDVILANNRIIVVTYDKLKISEFE